MQVPLAAMAASDPMSWRAFARRSFGMDKQPKEPADPSPQMSRRPPAPRSEASPRRRPPFWRDRLVPRTVLGIATILLAASIGAAFSGVSLYAYYAHRLDQSDSVNKQLATDFSKTFDNATKTIQADGQNARSDIQKELQPLRQLAAGGDVLTGLQKNVGPSVWFVQTQDSAGQPSVGSAFVVASDNNSTLLLCSFATVTAATRQPGPQITVSRGTDQEKATLWTWQPERDLALLILQKGNQPKLTFAPTSPPLAIGQRIFSISGTGGSGNAITQGFVADVSANGIQHDVAIGQAFQGGPLVNDGGQVVAISSRLYAPLGFTTDAVYFGIPSRAACEKVLKCPNNDPSGATQGAKP